MLNKEFFAPREDIKYGDTVVANVRGITPDDLALIMVENAADVEHMFTLLERDESIKEIDVEDPQQVSDALKTHGKQIFTTLVTKVPVLIAKIIAVACDAPEDHEHIRKNFTLPLQLAALTTVAQLTFIDSNGFRAFLGNVLALVGKGSDQSNPASASLTDSSGSSS